MKETTLEILKRYWGFESLRPNQKEVIEAVLNDEDTFAMLPTGGGKSLCFQLPALVKTGLTIVVSPLISLMLDQVQNLKSKGVNAFYLNSSLNLSEQEEIFIKVQKLETAIIYLSPEKLNSEWFRDRLGYLNISLVAIDEAHCVSQWGYDFRPEYLKIAESLVRVKCAKIALTATATDEVRQDIIEKLELKEPKVFLNDVFRSNLNYSVISADAKEQILINLLLETKGTTIIYCTSRKACHFVADLVTKQGKSVSIYHAGLSKEQRLIAQENLLKDKVEVIVATSAFGMGIDKADIRHVIHFGAPSSLEAYYQEAGRAGRDGLESYVTLLSGSEDEEFSRYVLGHKYPSIDIVRSVYDAVCNQFRIAYDFFLEGYQEIDITYLKEKTGLDFIHLHYALKILDLSKVLDYQQEYYTPSSLQFIVSPGTLHGLYKEDSDLESIIKSIIRILGADVYQEPQKINETSICNMAGVSQKKLRDTLVFLIERRVVRFYKGTDKPVVRFLIRRQKKIAINLVLIQFLKEREEKRLNEIYKYIETTNCRQQFISQYFGFNSKACGVCDSCLKSLPSRDKSSDLLGLLKDMKELSTSEIKMRLSPISDDEFNALLNDLVNAKRIEKNRVGKFQLRG